MCEMCESLRAAFEKAPTAKYLVGTTENGAFIVGRQDAGPPSLDLSLELFTTAHEMAVKEKNDQAAGLILKAIQELTKEVVQH